MRLLRTISLLAILTAAGTAFADEIIQPFYVGGSELSPTVNQGQSFTAIQSNLNSIGVMFSQFNFAVTSPVTVTMTLYTSDGWGGTALASSILNIPVSGTPTWYDFSFSGITALVVGQRYTFFMTVTQSGLGTMWSSNNPYAGGRAYFACYPCANFGTYTTSDLVFRVEGPPIETPEPSTFILLASGLLVAGLRLRKK